MLLVGLLMGSAIAALATALMADDNADVAADAPVDEARTAPLPMPSAGSAARASENSRTASRWPARLRAVRQWSGRVVARAWTWLRSNLRKILRHSRPAWEPRLKGHGPPGAILDSVLHVYASA